MLEGAKSYLYAERYASDWENPNRPDAAYLDQSWEFPRLSDPIATREITRQAAKFLAIFSPLAMLGSYLAALDGESFLAVLILAAGILLFTETRRSGARSVNCLVLIGSIAIGFYGDAYAVAIFLGALSPLLLGQRMGSLALAISTASPCPWALAEKVRARIDKRSATEISILASILVGTYAALRTLNTNGPAAVLAGVTFSLAAAVLALRSSKGALTHLPQARQIWESWLAYDYQGDKLGGHLVSPCGSQGRRVAVLFLTVLLSALGAASLPVSIVSAIPIWEAEAVNQPTVSPPDVEEPLLSTGQVIAGGSLILLHLFLPLAWTSALALLGMKPYLFAVARAKRIYFEEWRFSRAMAKLSKNRQSIPVCLNAVTGTPLFLNLSALFRHMWVVGQPGSGKTTLLLGLLTRLLYSRRVSVVYQDHKAMGTQIVSCLARVCRSLGIPFHVFSIEPGKTSRLFLLFNQEFWRSASIDGRVDMLCTILSLVSGPQVYGQSWFEGAAKLAVRTALSRREIKDFKGLMPVLEELMVDKSIPRELRGAGLQAYLNVSELASIPSLNLSDESGNPHPRSAIENQIIIEHIIDRQGVIYAALPDSMKDLSGRIGRLFAIGVYFSLRRAQSRPMQVIDVIDEFHLCWSDNLEQLLGLGREANYTLYLANQSVEQLRSRTSMVPVIEDTVGTQIWFSIRSLDDKLRFEKASGQALHIRRDYVRDDLGQVKSYTEREELLPLMPIKRIDRISATRNHAIAQFAADDGLLHAAGAPMEIKVLHFQSERSYRRDFATPWPEQTPETILINHDTGLRQPKSAPRPPGLDAVDLGPLA